MVILDSKSCNLLLHIQITIKQFTRRKKKLANHCFCWKLQIFYLEFIPSSVTQSEGKEKKRESETKINSEFIMFFLKLKYLIYKKF